MCSEDGGRRRRSECAGGLPPARPPARERRRGRSARLRGEPGRRAAVAGQLGASVTVIGTIARKGLAGALIGNTAEVVLDQLDSDILVLKPEDTLAHLEALLEK